MKIRIIILMVFLISPFWTTAQNSTELNSDESSYSFMRKQSKVGFNMGSSFTSGIGGSGLFSNTVEPFMIFHPAKKFNVVVGSVLSTSSFTGISPVQNNAGLSGNRFMSTTVYALGSYQLSPKMLISGGAWGERNNFSQMISGPQMNPNAFNLDAGGLMLGMEYKVTEKFSFGAEINVIKNGNPFMPYQTQGLFGPTNRYKQFP
jgi:hypothetical protein